MHALVQIVPRLPPAISGVGDYALLLARELFHHHELKTSFILTDQHWSGDSESGGFGVECVASRDARCFASTLDQAASANAIVLLHYVGYGYEKRGCPNWLIDGVDRWKRRPDEGKLAVFFHELSAFGPPWRSSFWVAPLQKRIASRLAKLSDGCVTTMRDYALRIESAAPQHRNRVVIQPVFSTVGEPETVRPLSERKPWLILFGGGAWTAKAVSLYTHALDSVCTRLGCERILAIGSAANVSWRGRTRFEQLGVLSAREVSAILDQARAGFVDYFSGYLAKSTIFAAYCAHGLLSVFPQENASEADGIRCGEHYVTVRELLAGKDDSAWQRIADNARRWYEAHDLRSTASVVARVLEGPPVEKPEAPLKTE
jgi:hypothetical protein